ncbi:procollagen C-endopeptidase enhancer 2-like [Myxocyprinus asiaticus]|uniref:procollagen C-endopeptidase enhancer 2-like n=1 Tax=Myxocyprinus asiaticus TaxID=70543 RepID=UPI0022219FEC|nr:procollagen C-endopeptidase enhancer 2-like [Myxocyprinus asiaticus]
MPGKMERLTGVWSLGLLLCLSFGGALSQTTNYTRPVFNCGGDLVRDSGFVGSEGFPSFYKPNSKCTWYITVPVGNVVMLTFRIFDLEADPLCRYDYLDVYNGHSNMVQKLGRFCGTFRPGALISTSNTMMIEMVSDSGTGGRGFLAYFSGGKPHVDEHQFCGGKLTKSQGSVKTPNWPEKNYPPGISCSWLITVEPEMVIEVKFDKFDLESDTYCRFDYVAFFNGGEKDNSRRIGKFCGDTAPQNIVTSSNVLLVQFVSDLSVTSDGFMATYNSIPRGHRTPTVRGDVVSGPRVQSTPTKPLFTPVKPVRPVAMTTERPTTSTTTTTTTTTEKPRPTPFKLSKPVRPPVRKPGPDGPKPAPAVNPMCAKACKRDGTIKTSFCTSEFVITGMLTALTPGPNGSLQATVSLIKAYKTGSLTITQAGETMSVKLVIPCKKCPLLRRGQNYILMGQVDDEGRGTLNPGSFTALYKAPHHKMLTTINKQPC